MPSSLLRTQSDNSESDTTSSGSDEELLENLSSSRNSERIANLYAAARPRPLSVNRVAGGLSARASEKIGQALLDGRRALLLRKWSNLLEAIKAIESSLGQSASNRGKSLEWRLPIIARLVRDVAGEMQSAMRNKRSLSSDEAKALQVLQQKLKSIPADYPYLLDINPTLAEHPTTPAGSALLDCLELSILSEGCTKICLDELELHTLPADVGSLPDILQRYSVHAQNGFNIPRITNLDLSDNPLTHLPLGLSDSLPDLEELDIRNTSIRLLSPDIVRFRSLTTVHGQRQQASNVKQLLNEAWQAGLRDQAKHVASLVDLVLHRVSPEQYVYLPPHLASLAEQSYVCVSCSLRCFPQDSTFLSASLVEPIRLFKRPVTNTLNPISPSEISKLWIGGSTWRFCTVCIVRHLATDFCGCLVCCEAQNRLDAGEGIRWARMQAEFPPKQ